MGHVEGGDVVQFGKGLYNGAVDTLPLLAGPLLGSSIEKIPIPKMEIDPRYGGAGIMGHVIGNTLVLEATTAGIGKLAEGATEVVGETTLASKVIRRTHSSLWGTCSPWVRNCSRK
jgi:hypothetical protein